MSRVYTNEEIMKTNIVFIFGSPLSKAIQTVGADLANILWTVLFQHIENPTLYIVQEDCTLSWERDHGFAGKEQDHCNFVKIG